MAIKGKSKSRSKQRSAPRPPRHEPVVPPTALLRRRWLLLAAGALAGVLSMVVLVWVTNNLRADEAVVEAGAGASRRRIAATTYQQAVRDSYSLVGVVQPGLPPTIFAEMDAALDAMADGKPPTNAEETFLQGADDAAKASKALGAFDVAEAIRDQGFDEVAASSFTGSASALARVLDLYRQAARVAASAASIGGTEQERLVDVAVDLRDTAQGELIGGWTRYLQALQAGGIPEAPTGGGPVPELGGG